MFHVTANKTGAKNATPVTVNAKPTREKRKNQQNIEKLVRTQNNPDILSEKSTLKSIGFNFNVGNWNKCKKVQYAMCNLHYKLL